MTDDLPRITPGQTWVSSRPRVQDRTILAFGRDDRYPLHDGYVVEYGTAAAGPQLTLDRTFAAWARRSGARPRVEE